MPVAGATVTVHGRAYRVPRQPTVVITVDGGDPRYFDDALARGLMPALRAMLARGGIYARGLGVMPSLTNPNNLSIVTGVSPRVHGIPGNHYLTAAGVEQQLTDPALLRADTIHAHVQRAGGRVLLITVKEKLRRLLGAGNVPAISAECVADADLTPFGIADVPALLARPRPSIYDWDLSLYALELGLAVHARVPLDLLYVSLTDFVQHTEPPGATLADRFLQGLDAMLERYLRAGFNVGITADHGMNAKPHIRYLADELAAAGFADARVILPITDPYVVHHGALGSFAWIYLPPAERTRARNVLEQLGGIDEVLTRAEATHAYDHPPDRIGDLSIAAAADTVLGTSRTRHDLTQLRGPLRSHGGRHEQPVPMILSGPVTPAVAARLAAGARNMDVHELLMVGAAGRPGEYLGPACSSRG